MKQYKITLPKSWSEVSISAFEELQAFIKTLKKDDNIYSTDIRMFSILSGVPYETLKDMDTNSYNECSRTLAFMSEPPKLYAPKTVYMLDNKPYKAYLGPAQWTAAQFIDFKTVASNESLTHRTARIIACFMSPQDCSYGYGYDPEELVLTIAEHMSVEEALSLSNFFTIEFRAFAGATLQSLEKRLRKSLRKEIPQQELNSLLEKLKAARDSISGSGLSR